MKRKSWKRALALAAAATMVVGTLAACGKTTSTDTSDSSAETTTDSTASDSGSKSDTLVVGEAQFNQKFSPFFAATQYDMDVAGMTQASLLGQDREGAIVNKGIEGETRAYNGTDYTYTALGDLEETENSDGTMDYDIKLRDDAKFSDGETVNADDVIFSMYVLSDPTYDGSSSFYSLPITGMSDYHSGMSSLLSLLAAAGPDNTDFSKWTQEEQDAFWNTDLPAAGEQFAQSIVDYCIANGYNAQGDSVAACAANWGYTLDDSATAADFWNAILAKYENDPVTAADTEKADKTLTDLLDAKYQKGIETGDSVPNIAGIKKVSDTEITIHMDKVDATAVYQLAISVAPMHYYGETDKYDYDNNKFGFDKGDLS
ncbi:MAG: ABC transporter substrate-binding protein, partial [Lachnospiraceae bacterium]|nr:ABC transporter substrate-binding protein [Lachnospiraceae bacterium]